MQQQAGKRFLSTKFYPVDIDAREIINDAHRTERDLAWKYKNRRPMVIGMRGKHLNAHPLYASFALAAA